MKYKILKFGLFSIGLVISVVGAVSHSNPVNGTVHGILWGTVLAIIFLMILNMIEKAIVSKKTIISFYGISIIAYAFLISLWHWYHLSPPSKILYERVLNLNPPSSATDLISKTEYPGKDIHFRLKFVIDSSDLELVLVNFSRTRRNPFLSHEKSSRWIYDSIDAFYLKNCQNVPWWDSYELLELPIYTWDDERYWRNLWFKDAEHDGKFVVYVSGIG